MDKKKISFIVVGVILLLVIIVLINNIEGLKDTLEEKNKNIESLSEELDSEKDINSNLSEQVASYIMMNKELIENVEVLDNKVEKLNLKLGNIELTLEEIDEHEESIRDSMSWFKENTELSEEFKIVRSGLRKFCIMFEDDHCEVKTVCLRLINELFHFLKYRQDVVTSGKIDFLQNLSSIFENSGGDCEDFSLLAMAELNYLKGECDDRELRFESFDWMEGYSVFVDYTDKYRLNGAKFRKIDDDLNNFYVVCGTFPGRYDPEKRFFSIFGHCVLGISSVSINSSDGVADFLRKSVLIEPQDGSFIVDLRERSIFEIPENEKPLSSFFLRIVITDRDLYRFDMEEFRWIGYEDYIGMIEEAKEKIRKLQ